MLLSFDGKTTKELMPIFDVERLTISHWFNAWESRRFAGLDDHAGRGRPHKLTEAEQEQAHQYMAQHPQHLKKVVPLIAQETSKRVSTKTIKRLLKKNCSVWKRIKHPPEKSPDPEKSERSKALINQLHTRERHGEGDVWSFEASGFCFTPSMPYAWQLIGSVIEVPTSAQNRRRNV